MNVAELRARLSGPRTTTTIRIDLTIEEAEAVADVLDDYRDDLHRRHVGAFRSRLVAALREVWARG